MSSSYCHVAERFPSQVFKWTGLPGKGFVVLATGHPGKKSAFTAETI